MAQRGDSLVVGMVSEAGYAGRGKEDKEMASESELIARLRTENARLRKALATAIDELYPGSFPLEFCGEVNELLGKESPWVSG